VARRRIAVGEDGSVVVFRHDETAKKKGPQPPDGFKGIFGFYGFATWCSGGFERLGAGVLVVFFLVQQFPKLARPLILKTISST
jgi:hypothetical protein